MNKDERYVDEFDAYEEFATQGEGTGGVDIGRELVTGLPERMLTALKASEVNHTAEITIEGQSLTDEGGLEELQNHRLVAEDFKAGAEFEETTHPEGKGRAFLMRLNEFAHSKGGATLLITVMGVTAAIPTIRAIRRHHVRKTSG